MKQSQEVLRAFFLEKLKEQGLEEPDDELLNVLSNTAELREGTSNIKEEERYVKIEKDSEETVSARRISAYNLLEISLTDMLDLLIPTAGLAALKGGPKLAIVLAILALINEFVKKSTVELNETDARVLLAIHLTGADHFTKSQVKESYLKEFGSVVEDEQLARSLNAFRKSFIVSYIGNDTCQLEEHLEYDRS